MDHTPTQDDLYRSRELRTALDARDDAARLRQYRLGHSLRLRELVGQQLHTTPYGERDGSPFQRS